MIIATSDQQLADLVMSDRVTVFFFTADWCPDCQYIYPAMPEIEALFQEVQFVRVDRDAFMDLAQKWSIYGIPSFVVTQKGVERGRLVSKLRKRKEEIVRFLASVC